MPHGCLTEEMRRLLAPHVKGKAVWDFGAGDLTYAREMCVMGATKVVALDKESMPNPRHPNIEVRQKLFRNVVPPTGGIDVALIAWPQNSTLLGLLENLVVSRKVIYLGSNTDGNACGNVILFHHLIAREVLDYVPHRRNSLVVYGGWLREQRGLLPEEWAALHPEKMWSFAEATQASSEPPTIRPK